MVKMARKRLAVDSNVIYLLVLLLIFNVLWIKIIYKSIINIGSNAE
jgi:hypothetical protein